MVAGRDFRLEPETWPGAHASVERTRRVLGRVEAIARNTPGVAHTVGISGQSLILNANAPNLGSLYVMLDPFEHLHTHPCEGIGLGVDFRLQFDDDLARNKAR